MMHSRPNEVLAPTTRKRNALLQKVALFQTNRVPKQQQNQS
jgi:hypothetical protein